MKLFLSSYRFGELLPELAALVGQGSRVAVIANATDFIPDADRRAYAERIHDPIALLTAQGLPARALDLRRYFGRPDALAADLAGVGLVWVNGGNAFLLMRAMRASGFEQIAPPLVRRGVLAYGGWSAGACAAGPDLRGIELMDDPAQLAPGYPADPVWDGLGLIGERIVPHFASDHPEAEAAARCAAALSARGLAHRTLRDGEALVSDGDGLTLLGEQTP